MKLAEKFFNESYENEKRFRLEAEKAKAEQLKKECLKVFENIIQPKIEGVVKNGLYSADFDEDELDKCGICITDILFFLRSEGFIIKEDHVNDVIIISWFLHKSPMSEDPQYR
jgi:hypothetical protein